MSQAVGDPATIEPVPLNLQFKGRTLPLGRVRRHHIEVGTHKSDRAVGLARIGEDQVAAPFGVAHPLNPQSACLHQGFQFFADHVTGQVFLRRRLVFERRVLQVFAHRHHAAQHAQKTFIVQSPGSEIHTRVQTKCKVQSARCKVSSLLLLTFFG